jgi:hypothetical protein
LHKKNNKELKNIFFILYTLFKNFNSKKKIIIIF